MTSYLRFKETIEAWGNMPMEPGQVIVWKGYVDPDIAEEDAEQRAAIAARRAAAAERSSLRITSLDNGCSHRLVDITWVTPSHSDSAEPSLTAQLQLIEGKLVGGRTRHTVPGETKPRDEAITATTLKLMETFPHDRLAARGLLEIAHMEWESSESAAPAQ